MLTFAELRRREFARLDAQGQTYVDYTGSALYGVSQIRAHQALLAEGIYGNPHAESPSSRASTERMDRAREVVLRFFDTDDSTHEVIFTANATAAAKLVGESYPFDRDAVFSLSIDNHNSINGIREFARRAGASVRYLDLRSETPVPVSKGLFAFPAQSNFTGNHFPLELVDVAHDAGYDVLLDAAAFAPARPLSLRSTKADFTLVSFYKLFGYPTGVGALIARRDALARLRRPWFAGGTVMYASVAVDTHRLRMHHEAFEDGTPDFLNIAALPAGFALLEQIGMDRIESHVDRLTSMFLDEIASSAILYGRIAFNVEGVPFWEVEEEARRRGISLRGGCFCNPGASELAFGLERETISACFDAMGGSFSVERFAACSQRTVGALRVSFGVANNEDDVRRTAGLIRHFARKRSQSMTAVRSSRHAAAN